MPPSEEFKRKSNTPGWIAFAVVVLFTIWYAKHDPESANVAATRDPDSALKMFAEQSQSYLRSGPAGAGQSGIEAILALCEDNDREWFEKNYEGLYQVAAGKDPVAARADPNTKKSRAMAYLLEHTIHTTNYEVVSKNELSKTVNYRLKVNDGFGKEEFISIALVQQGRYYKVADIGGYAK